MAAPDHDQQRTGDLINAAPEELVDPGWTPADVPGPLAWHRRPAVQRRLRLIARLLGMRPPEVAHRLAKAGRKRLRRAAARRSAPRPPTPEDAARVLPPPAAADPVAYLRGAVGFFDHDRRAGLVALARLHVPGAVERTIREARAIEREGIELLGRRFRPADPGFDWHADPDRGRLWPCDVLDDADAVRGVRADVKFVWEVNRHQFVVTLARGALYTGDEGLARTCVAMVQRWIATNPPGLGVNWASNLEVAVRALSWLWALQLLVGLPAVEADELRRWLVSLRQHRDHLAANLSTYTDATNHLIGEAAALASLAIWLPDWPNAGPLCALAVETLERELDRQVAPDGVDREQATSYQRFVCDLVLQVILLADRNRVPLPPSLRAHVAALLTAAQTLSGPGFRAPRIGDSDDARGLPFFTEDPWDFGELLAIGSAVLGADTAPRAPRLYESALWLGSDALVARHTGAAPDAASARSEILPHGGYAVLRSVRRPAEDRVLFDCGPLGYAPHASHGHADILMVLADVGGEELLIDPGSYAYFDEHGRRDLFRGTRSHNTIEVDGRDQADAFDPFKWMNLPHTGLEVARLGSDVEYVEAWHDGYERLRSPVRHRRGVLGAGGAWLLIDWLEGEGEHRFTRWFHLAPGARIERVDRGRVRLLTPSGRDALALADVGGEDAPTVPESVTWPYSERYGRQVEAPAIRLVDQARLPALRVTLLAPTSASRLQVERAYGSRGTGALLLRLEVAENPPLLLALRVPGAPTRLGEIETAARAALVRNAEDAQVLWTSGGTAVGWVRA